MSDREEGVISLDATLAALHASPPVGRPMNPPLSRESLISASSKSTTFERTIGNPIKVFSGNSNPSFAHEVAEYLGVEVGKARVSRFSDGEIRVEIDESVRGADVYVVQSTSTPVNDNLMEMLIMFDALKRASAGSISAVIPYFCAPSPSGKDFAAPPMYFSTAAISCAVANDPFCWSLAKA